LCQLDYAFNKRKAENKKWREKHQIKEPDTKTTEPVLLVQTHTDEDGKQNSNQGSRKYVEEFHVALNETAVKNNVYKLGLELLKETLLQYISAKNIGKVEDKYFDEFQKYLLAKAENSIYSPENISIESNVFKQYKQFRKDYSENKKITENDETLFEFMQSDLERLYQKGLVLYYKSNEQLENVVWLNPTETVKHIHDEVFPKEKNKNILIKKHGIVSKTDFNKLCKDNKIKELLMSEKVIFLDEHENKYIVPGYLQLSDEDKLFKHLSLEYMEPAFILKFQKFIPFGLINQLICLYGNFPNEKLYWRDQLFFWFNNHRVWIKLDFPQLSIAVYINSFNKKQETNIPLKQTEIEHCIFFNIIDLYYGNEIPLKYPDTESPKEKQTDDGESKRLLSFTEQVKEYIRYKEGMKFPDDMYLSVDGEHFISHEKLQSAEANQKTIPAYTLEKTNQKTKKGETIEVIGTVTSKTEPVSKYLQFSNNKNIKDMKKIFISYSREDVGFKNMLKKHLNMLSVVGSIADNWSCEEIGIDKWDKKIQEKLDESDLVIYMLSVDFFSSPYILEKEVQNVIEGKKGEKKILCVIVREFIGLDKIADYTDRIGSMINVSDKQKAILALKDFQYLPYGMDWNSITKQDRERITPLKEYSNKGEIDKALTQITTKILELFNKEF
jgi:internalin A